MGWSWGGAGQGAASGAGTGAIAGPWGAAIGGVAGGIMGGFRGGDKKKPKTTATEDALTKSLTNQSTKLNASGDALSGDADQSMKVVTDYFKALAGGDAAALMDATKAERGRVIDQYDTARDAMAKFGPRGGGSTSASAASRISEANQISDITATARANAADKLAGVGVAEQGVGLGRQQLASSDLNTLINKLLTEQGFDITKRGQNMDAVSGLGEGLGTLLGLYLTKGKSAGAGGGGGGSSFPSTIYGSGAGYAGG